MFAFMNGNSIIFCHLGEEQRQLMSADFWSNDVEKAQKLIHV